MSARSGSSLYPRNAYLLSLIGGVLIVVYAIYEVAASIEFSARIESIVHGGSRLLLILGVLVAVVGFVIVFLALRLKSSPRDSRQNGILIIVLSLVSFVGGGGLFLGLILAFLGGIVAMTWRPPTLNPTMYGSPGWETPIRQPAGPIPWQTPSSPTAPPGVPQRFCPSCGTPNVATAQYCAKCGASMG